MRPLYFNQSKARKNWYAQQCIIQRRAKLFAQGEMKALTHTHIPSPVLGFSYSAHFSLPVQSEDNPSDPEAQDYL